MAKQAGLGDRLFVSGVNLSGDTQALGAVGGGPAVIDVTGIDRSAFERIGGLRDGRIEWVSFLNPSAGRAHPTLSTLPTGDRIVTYLRGAALGGPGACLVGKQLNYDPTRNADGSITIALQAQANGFGLEWGRQLTAGIETLGAAGAGTGVDHSASTAFGLTAYLHVFAFTGTSATVTVQQSSDDGAVDPYADVTGALFTAVSSAPATERVSTARDATIERWLRINVTGTFSDLQLAAVVTKPDVEVLF